MGTFFLNLPFASHISQLSFINLSTKMTENYEAMQRQRMEKDLQELQTLISRHFEQRKVDDSELENLESRIRKRKEERQEQIRVRQQREKERQQKEKEERARKEEEEKARQKVEEERKKQAIQAMSQNYGGYLARGDRDKRGNRKQTERKKPLNIEHLQGEKLKDKVNGLWNWFKQLEEE